MGSSNVAAVLTHWPARLSHPAFRALVCMANMSLDDGAPSVYFGGWGPLAHALGRSDPGKGNPLPRPDHEAVRRAVAELIECKAIRRTRHGRQGSRAEYELTLHPWE
jgi:hypothetical protein